MLSEGYIDVDAVRVELASLSELEFRAQFPRATELIENAPHRSYALGPADVEGQSCFSHFYFTDGRLTALSLTLDGDWGEPWTDKVWELSYLEMLEREHRSWLGRLLGRAEAVARVEFEWGGASVNIDTKGWGTSLCMRPRRDPRSAG